MSKIDKGVWALFNEGFDDEAEVINAMRAGVEKLVRAMSDMAEVHKKMEMDLVAAWSDKSALGELDRSFAIGKHTGARAAYTFVEGLLKGLLKDPQETLPDFYFA